MCVAICDIEIILLYRSANEINYELIISARVLLADNIKLIVSCFLLLE